MLLSIILLAPKTKGRANGISLCDTVPRDSYDIFKNKPNDVSPYVILKSKETGEVLFERTLENGKCADCYDTLTSKADAYYKNKKYSDAALLYFSAFTLNNNKGKVKHRLNAACCFTKINDVDKAFENLNKVVFNAQFHNIYEISSNECFNPLQKDHRWAPLIQGLKNNLDKIQQKLSKETIIEEQRP